MTYITWLIKAQAAINVFAQGCCLFHFSIISCLVLSFVTCQQPKFKPFLTDGSRSAIVTQAVRNVFEALFLIIWRLHLYIFLGPNVRYVNGGPPPNDESIGIIRHSGPANTKFSTLEARLRTFKDWPPALKQEPRQLADAGFYYIGLSDQTKCFYCEGGLRNWQPDDDPWTEHARWFSKCGYVRLIKGDDFILNCVDKKPPSHQGGKDKPISGGSPDLKALMTMPIVQEVLAMGISQPRIELALKQKAVDRKMFSTANELATAALSVQLEEQARIIPNSTESQASSVSFIFIQGPRSILIVLSF